MVEHDQDQWEENRVFVALGANLAYNGLDPLDNIDKAVQMLVRFAGAIEWQLSSAFESEAWPNPSDPLYTNAVIGLHTQVKPIVLLQGLQAIEYAFGRPQHRCDRGKNQPRAMDLDIIDFGGKIIREPDLIVPHPRMKERLFVLYPLSEICPTWVHPETGERIETLIKGLKGQKPLKRVRNAVKIG